MSNGISGFVYLTVVQRVAFYGHFYLEIFIKIPTFATDLMECVMGKKRRKRPFQKDIVNHCYQRTADGGLIFYSYSDYLVWFTTICTVARRHKVTLLSMCPMPDHVHLTVVAVSRNELSDFMREYSSQFSQEHNRVCHRKGQLFARPYGSAPKYGAKHARTHLIYVGNNPVERQLASRAEDYRWTFLAYAVSDHPFSPKLVIRKARWPMKQAVSEVRNQYQAGKPLSYAQLQRLFKPLTPEERQQLTDFIIATYNVLDYQTAISFFHSYEDMLNAMHSSTGSEYDLNEVFIGKSDAHYAKMVATVMREVHPDDIHDILAYPPEKKREVWDIIRKYSYAMSEQIAKFLHLPYKFGPVDFP